MKSVSIVGLGWLGLPLAQYLKQQGWAVKGTKQTEDDAQAMKKLGIDCYLFTLTQSEFPSEIVQAEALVINIPANATNVAHYVVGIKRLISHGILQKVRYILFVSSSSVFPQQDGVFDEQSLTVGSDVSSQALIELETWLLSLDITCDILRLAGLFGQARHPVKYLAGKTDLTAGSQPVNLVHLNDVIGAIELLLNNPQGQRIFNLCAPSHPTRESYYTQAAKRLGLPPPHFTKENRGIQRIIDGSKICRELGFQYQHDLID